MLLDTDEEIIDGEEATSLAVVKGGGGWRRARVSRARPTRPDLPVPEDAESMADLSERSAIALPVPDEEDGRPGRRRARRGGGLSFLLLFGALLVPGAYFGGKYVRVWFGGADSAASASAGATDHAAGPATAGTHAAEKQAAAPDAGVAARKPEAEEPPSARHAGEPTAGHEATHESAHEATARRHGGERSRDFVGRDISRASRWPPILPCCRRPRLPRPRRPSRPLPRRRPKIRKAIPDAPGGRVL